MAEQNNILGEVLIDNEDVMNFRNTYGDKASERLAATIVGYQKEKLPESLRDDDSYLSLGALMDGTAGYLDNLPAFKGLTPENRALSTRGVNQLLSNMEPLNFMEEVGRAVFRSVPATTAFVGTAGPAGRFIIPKTTAAGASIGSMVGALGGPAAPATVPLGAATGAAIGAGVGAIATLAASLGFGMVAYNAAEKLEEIGLDPRDVVDPSQRKYQVGAETAGDFIGGLGLPFQVGKKRMVAIADETVDYIKKDPVLKNLNRIDEMVGKINAEAYKNPVSTVAIELAGAGGSSVGATAAEDAAAGSGAARLVGEGVGGMAGPIALMKVLQKAVPAFTSGASKLGDKRKNKAFKKINEVFSKYGTADEYDLLIAELQSEENARLLKEFFPSVKFTAAQVGDNDVLRGIEAGMSSQGQELEEGRKIAQAQGDKTLLAYLSLLSGSGDQRLINIAADARVLQFQNNLENNLESKIRPLLQAQEKLQGKTGGAAVKSREEISEKIYNVIQEVYEEWGKVEKRAYDAVPDFIAFNVNKSEGFGDDFKVLPYDPNRPDPIISTRDPRYTEAGGDVLPKSTTDDLFGDPNRLKVEEPIDRAAAKKTTPVFLDTFGEILYEGAPTNKKFKEAAPYLFEIVEDVKRRTGLIPDNLTLEDVLIENSLEKDFLARYKNLKGSSKNEVLEREEFLQAVLQRNINFEDVPTQGGGFYKGEAVVTPGYNNLREEAGTPLEVINREIKKYTNVEVEPKFDKKGIPIPPKKRYDPSYLATLERAKELIKVRNSRAAKLGKNKVEKYSNLEPVNFNLLKEYRSQLLTLARELAPTKPDFARRVGVVAESILNDMDNAIAVKSTLPEATKLAYRTARDLTKTKNDVFKRTFANKIVSSDKTGKSLSDPLTLMRLITSPREDITLSRTRQIRDLAKTADQKGVSLNVGSEEGGTGKTVFTTVDSLYEGYLRNLKQFAGKKVYDPKTGKDKLIIDDVKLSEWKENNKDLLDLYPAARQDLEDVISAQRALEFAEARKKDSLKTLKQQKYLQGLTDGINPQIILGEALRSKNPKRELEKLFALRSKGVLKDNYAKGFDSKIPVKFEDDATIALKKSRADKIRKAGGTQKDIKEAFKKTIIEYVLRESGMEAGKGQFNPVLLNQALNGPLSKGSKVSLLDVAADYGIFTVPEASRLKFMTEQMRKVYSANIFDTRMGNNLAEKGQLNVGTDFYAAIIGSAAGTRAYKAVGGTGAGTITAAGKGSSAMRNLISKLPAAAKNLLVENVLLDPETTAQLLLRPKSNKPADVEAWYRTLTKTIGKKLFIERPLEMTPAFSREGSEEIDKEMEALRQRFENINFGREAYAAEPPNTTSSVNSPRASNIQPNPVRQVATGPVTSPTTNPTAVGIQGTITPESAQRFAQVFGANDSVLTMGIGGLVR